MAMADASPPVQQLNYKKENQTSNYPANGFVVLID